jgi:hypothetical protein
VIAVVVVAVVGRGRDGGCSGCNKEEAEEAASITASEGKPVAVGGGKGLVGGFAG